MKSSVKTRNIFPLIKFKTTSTLFHLFQVPKEIITKIFRPQLETIWETSQDLFQRGQIILCPLLFNRRALSLYIHYYQLQSQKSCNPSDKIYPNNPRHHEAKRHQELLKSQRIRLDIFQDMHVLNHHHKSSFFYLSVPSIRTSKLNDIIKYLLNSNLYPVQLYYILTRFFHWMRKNKNNKFS